jgi:hypothetical protein
LVLRFFGCWRDGRCFRSVRPGIGDIDGDGHADLVFQWWSNSLGVMLSDGKGGFGTPYGFFIRRAVRLSPWSSKGLIESFGARLPSERMEVI